MSTDLARRNEILYRIARELNTLPLDVDAVLKAALRLGAEAAGVQHGCIATFMSDGALEDAYLLGADQQVRVEREMWEALYRQGVIGYALSRQRAVVIRNLTTDPRWALPEGSPLLESGSALGLPLPTGMGFDGTLMLLHPEVDYFDESMVDLLEEAAALITNTLARALELEAAFAREDEIAHQNEETQQLLEERLRLEQLRRDLTAMTYHDLRGPLQNIYNSLSALERLSNSSDRVLRAEFLRLATQSTRQITRMVKGLLDIERLEEGDTPLDRKRVALALLINDAADMVSSTVIDAEQELRLEVDPALPHVHVDPDMIMRVIINLIENAAKHTPAGGIIQLRAEVADGAAHIYVTDTGPGIPQDVIGQIFDKYYRVRRPDAPNGVGLGLAFCRLAVEAHGGRIWAESVPNNGTQFSFALPVDEHEPAVMRTAV